MKNLKPYTKPSGKRLNYPGVLCDLNERTIPPSKKVLAALKETALEGKVQCYPEYEQLQQRLAIYTGAASSQIMLTNGSDQAISLAITAFTRENDQVIIPKPSFSMFFLYANAARCKIISPNYNKK